MALLEETAFLNSVEANIGSWAMALTCDLHGPFPDIAPTPSRPTVPVSIALPSRMTTASETTTDNGK
jgi:hypothetical protein